MDQLGQLYLEWAAPLFLIAFIAISIGLVLGARHLLHRGWWVGAGVSGLVMIGLMTLFALAVRALVTGETDMPLQGWLAIGAAGIVGFVAGLDVQLLWGALRRRSNGAGSVVAGALLGPVLIVGGYLLLAGSMEWIRTD